MRTLPAALLDEMRRLSTRIGYLVEITPLRVGSAVIRLCSKDDIVWNGVAWPQRHFVMQSPPMWAGNSAMAWAVAMNNADRALGTVALAGGLRGARYRSWILSCANPRPALADVQPWLNGWMVDDSIGSDTFEANVSTEYSIASFTPRQRIYKPEFNWPPPLNSTVTYGGGTIQFTDGVST
jgi:hypothetical protein